MQSTSTGNIILDGVVQIVAAHVAHNAIEGDKVPDLMKKVSTALIDCVRDAAAAFGTGVPSASVAPAAPAVTAVSSTALLAAPASAATEQAAPAARGRRSTRTARTRTMSAPEQAAEAVEAAQPEAEVATAPQEMADLRKSNLPTEPAVPIEESIRPDAIVCLFDGEARKMLHRHIRSKYNMSPEEYRSYWNLPADYPMTAPGYSEEKRLVAVSQGLGHQKAQTRQRENSPAKSQRRVRQTA